MHVQVVIVGAGPAGLLLSQLLHLQGIDNVVLERRSRAHVESRIRAGVLEHGTAELLAAAGVGDRMRREGLVHRGIELSFDRRRHRLDFPSLTGGKAVTVYGQTELTKDLNAARLAAGARIVFEAEDVRLAGIGDDTPRVHYRALDAAHTLECDYVAGCDGFHGVCRRSVAADRMHTFEHVYPFAWLGILAHTPPVSEELVYARHARGFALFSMRTPRISRLYLQVPANEHVDGWPDARIWDELRTRLDGNADDPFPDGPIVDKSVTPLRSFVAEPMRFGRLFLAGDAAHIVPPTGAKGLNLAVADVRVLAEALAEHYQRGSERGLETYSQRCLRRVWKAQRFSGWMTALLHRFPDEDEFQHRLRLAELDYLSTSTAAATALAENYVGLPFD